MVFMYHGRTVQTNSQRAKKIELWEKRKAEKRKRRTIKRETGKRHAIPNGRV